MRGARMASRVVLSVLGAALFTSCGGSGEPDRALATPQTGSITVDLATTGVSPDADGYSLHIADRAQIPIAVAPSPGHTISHLQAGPTSVSVSGMACNCAAANVPRSVNVVGNTDTRVPISIECMDPMQVRDPITLRDGTALPRAANVGTSSLVTWSEVGEVRVARLRPGATAFELERVAFADAIQGSADIRSVPTSRLLVLEQRGGIR